MNRLAQGIELLQPDVLPSGVAGTAGVDFASYFGGITTTVFALAATLAVLMVTVGGVQYIMSDVVTSKQAAKERIMSALVGLALLIVIALILNTINPNLLSLDAFINSAKAP